MDDMGFFIQSFVAFFVIIDAIGNVPIFISLLDRFSYQDRNSVIKRATLIALITLLIVTLTGDTVFRYLSIEMYSFKVAGGVLLMIISIEMLFGRKSRTEATDDVEERKQDLTVTPLAIPLLTGPGAMTTGVVLFDAAGSELRRLLVLASILLAFMVSYIILLKAQRIFRFLGKTGTKVVIRVMGLLLLSIAVQFIINGVTEAALASNTFL